MPFPCPLASLPYLGLAYALPSPPSSPSLTLPLLYLENDRNPTPL
jgi:hypothetical protein